MNRLPTQTPSYHKFSLKELVTLVVQIGDSAALDEISSRPLFYIGNQARLNIPKYLYTLRDWATTRTWRSDRLHEAADMAYDITIDKFFNLHEKHKGEVKPHRPKNHSVKRKGPNCRLYWGAFLKHVRAGFEKKPPKGHLDVEIRCATALQGFVKRHFVFSLLEAERSTNEFWSRYNWQLGDNSINVWLPRFLKGSERRAWLEKHVKDPDPTRSGERERIQTIIGRRLVNMVHIPFNDDIGVDPSVSIIDKISGKEQFGFSLSSYVAAEKSEDIISQRRSIRNLGKKKLKQLVLRIFEDLEAGDFKDQQVAHDFGLSKATFSRFAGSKWSASETGTIPDLWLNTAQVLATQPAFKKTASAAGFWDRVEGTLKKANRN